MLLHRWQPEALSQIIGNPDIITEVRLWAQSWKQGNPQKPLLLVGPPGIGKTATAYALAKEMGFSLVEFNASSARDKESVEKIIGASAQNASFDGALRLVLMDEIDGIHSRGDRGGAAALPNVIKQARNPIFFTANEIYGNKNLVTLRSYCKILMGKRIPSPTLAKFLREVCEKEGIEYDAHSINALAKRSSGDVRAALLDLEAMSKKNNLITLEDVESSGYRERLDNIFSVIRTLFTNPSLKEIRKARFTSEVDHDLLKKWVDENIPRQFPSPTSLANAYSQLSRADMFDGRIFRRQHYGFLKYSGDLASSVGLVTPDRAHGFISYQFPSILKRLSAGKGSAKKSLLSKLGEKTHGSRRRWGQDLPYLRILFADPSYAIPLTHHFQLEPDEVAYLLDTSPSHPKVKKIFAQLETDKAASPKGSTKKSRTGKTVPNDTDNPTTETNLSP
ncbi:MAG: replication factor C large subunit, partial [archaeon]|nr:replication factor C large subunit [archaeon]